MSPPCQSPRTISAAQAVPHGTTQISAAVGAVAPTDLDTRLESSSGVCERSSKRQAFFGGWREVPVYALDALQPGHSLTGPAIIEAETTTVLVDTGDRVSVNALGWLDITLR